MHFEEFGGTLQLVCFAIAALVLDLLEHLERSVELAGEALLLHADHGDGVSMVAEGGGHGEGGLSFGFGGIYVRGMFGYAECQEIQQHWQNACRIPLARIMEAVFGEWGECRTSTRRTELYTNCNTHVYTDRHTRCYTLSVKPAIRTPNVRLSPRAHALLRKIADEEQQSMQAVLDEAIERYRRERFLYAANADFAALKRDAKAWREEIRERELWERTLADGLGKK